MAIKRRVLGICAGLFVCLIGMAGCSEDNDGGGGDDTNGGGGDDDTNGGGDDDANGGGADDSETELTPLTPIEMNDELPSAGVESPVDVPTDALPADTSTPTTIVGSGTPESCTSDAFVEAVWNGGVITFDCGAEPTTIELEETAEVNNLGEHEVVIDGGGLVTLSGGGKRRILYQNVCLERLGWATSDCWGQGFPAVTLQNLTFVNGFTDDNEGGGAVHVSGGRLKIVNSRFFHNSAPFEGPDEGGGAVRVERIQEEPVYVVQSTFGGDGDLGNSAANGGALSGLFANFHVYNTVFVNNDATACCGNPATSGTGGGSGGAIYMDGLNLELELHNTRLEDNSCRAHGSAIFFVSNDHAGVLTITDSLFRNNAEGEGNWYAVPDISMHDDTSHVIENTTFE